MISTRAGARGVGTRNVPVGKAGFKDAAGKTAVVDTEREKVAKEEARKRTLTDFRIVGLEIKSLGWKWGVVRPDVEQGSDDEDDEDEDDHEAQAEDEGDGKQGDQLQEEITEEAAVERDVKGEPTGAPEVEVKVKVEQVTEAPDQTTDKALTESEPEVAPLVTLDEEELATNEAKDKPADSTDAQVVKEEQEERSEGEDKVDASAVAVGAASSTLEGKRGEKRKAKMSSPDAGLSPFPLSSSCLRPCSLKSPRRGFFPFLSFHRFRLSLRVINRSVSAPVACAKQMTTP